jgi:hypothetical protein
MDLLQKAREVATKRAASLSANAFFNSNDMPWNNGNNYNTLTQLRQGLSSIPWVDLMGDFDNIEVIAPFQTITTTDCLIKVHAWYWLHRHG